MSGGVEALGAVASALTAAEVVLNTVKTIQHVFHAIRDADIDVADQEARFEALRLTLIQVKDSLEQRGDKLQLAAEKRHHAAITKILNNCLRDLEFMQLKLPKLEETDNTRKKGIFLNLRKKPKLISNATKALEQYIREDSRLSTRLQRNLEVLQWSIFTVTFPQSWDGTEATLSAMRKIPPEHTYDVGSGSSNIRLARNLPNRGEIGSASEVDEHDVEDIKDIDAWENSWVALSTTVVSAADIPQVNTGAIAERRTSQLPSVSGNPFSHTPRRRKGEVEIEFLENEKMVQHFQTLNLQFYAAIYQRKGIRIKEELEKQYEEPFGRRARASMEECLAHILLASKAPECKDEARDILANLISPDYDGQLDAAQRNSIAYTLGKLYFDLGQYADAIELLRSAFYGHLDMSPGNKHLAREKLMDISNTVSDANHALGEPGRARAWEWEAHQNLGTDYIKPSEALSKALTWCRDRRYDVQLDIGTGVAKPSKLFDLVLDEKENSPLHEAAGDTEIDSDVLREMLRHVNSLEARNKNCDTPLLIAVGASNKTAVVQLLRRFADPHVRSEGRSSDGGTVLHKCKDPEIGALLLARLGAPRRGSMADDPLDRGENSDGAVTTIETPNRYGMSPLHCACKAGTTAMVSFLLAHGADPDSLSYANGRPLDCALTATRLSKQNRREIVGLIAAKADLRLKNKHGETYLAVLKKGGFTPQTRNSEMLDRSLTEASPSDFGRNDSFSMASSTRTSSTATAATATTATTFAGPATPTSFAPPNPVNFLDLDFGTTGLGLDMAYSESD